MAEDDYEIHEALGKMLIVVEKSRDIVVEVGQEKRKLDEERERIKEAKL